MYGKNFNHNELLFYMNCKSIHLLILLLTDHTYVKNSIIILCEL